MRLTVWLAEQLFWVAEFSVHSKRPLWNLFLACLTIALKLKHALLAHLGRRLIWWAYRIGRPPSYVIVHRRPHSLNIFSTETTGPIKVKFHMELQWDGGMTVCSNGHGHMTKMATMPIYVKNLKKSSPELKETWYASLGARVQPSLLKWWPLVDLDLFYGKVRFGPLCFCMGKR